MGFKLDGTLNHETAAAVRARLLEAVGNAAGTLLADLSEIESMDSAGAAVLVETLGLSRRRGIRFGILNPSSSFVKMVDVLRLTGLFPVERRDSRQRRAG